MHRSLVGERALTSGLCVEGSYFEMLLFVCLAMCQTVRGSSCDFLLSPVKYV